MLNLSSLGVGQGRQRKLSETSILSLSSYAEQSEVIKEVLAQGK